MVKQKLNPPCFPLCQRGIISKRLIKPLFEKEGPGEIYSANFWVTTLEQYSQQLSQQLFQRHHGEHEWNNRYQRCRHQT
jgi:hypothetical protein